MRRLSRDQWQKFFQINYWKNRFGKKKPELPPQYAKISQTIQDTKNKLKQERSIWKRWLPDTRPWYMIIGPNRSGKTSLILNANYQPISSTSYNQNTLPHTTDIDIWRHDDHIMIDITSEIFTGDHAQVQMLWNILKKNHTPNGVDAIILALDIETLCQSTKEFNQLINKINNHTQPIKNKKTDYPIHLFITQCDLIPGFSLFYNLQGDTENDNPAITSAFKNTDMDTLEAFHAGFSEQQKNIHANTLKQFNQKDTTARQIDFCLHFEKLGQRLNLLIKNMPWCRNIHLAGIYFTSTQNSHHNMINLSDGLWPPAAKNILSQDESIKKTHFIAQNIKNLNHNSAQVCKKNWWRTFSPFVSGAIIALIIFSTWFLAHEKYKHHATWQQDISTHIIASKNTNTLNKLQAIYSSEQYLQQALIKMGAKPENLKKQTLYQSLEKTKRHILTHQFLTELDGMVTDKLNSNLHKDNTVLYDTLKAYLMLHGSGPYSSPFLKIWFIQHKTGAQEHNIEAYSKALDDLFSPSFTPIPTLNKPLIARARDAIEKQPTANTAYSILANTISKTGIDLSSIFKQNNLLRLTTPEVPAIYTINNFSHMYNVVIPNIMLLIKSKDWVLNQNIGQQIPPKQKSDFISAIRQLYLSHYAQTWENILNNIHFTKTTQLKDIQAQLNILINKNSILWQTFDIVSQNTDNNNPNSDFYKIVTNPFSGLANINPNNMQDSNPFHQAVNHLNTFVTKIINTPSAPEISFNLAKNHASGLASNDPLSKIKTFANEQPTAANQWLTEIENNIWQALLNNAAGYINQSWRTTIYEPWSKKTKSYYPFDKDSADNISLDDFNQLMAKNGALDRFYNNAIKPFINDQKSYWQAKTIDRGSLPISQQAIDFFIRTDIIRKSFYNQNRSHASTTMSISLAGSSPKDVWATFEFNKHSYTLNLLNKFTALTWPVTQKDVSTINILNKKGYLSKITGQGPWSILRLIDQGTLSIKHPPNQFMLSLGNNKATVNLAIRFRQNSNPLIPGLLSEFKLPTTLSKQQQ